MLTNPLLLPLPQIQTLTLSLQNLISTNSRIQACIQTVCNMQTNVLPSIVYYVCTLRRPRLFGMKNTQWILPGEF